MKTELKRIMSLTIMAMALIAAGIAVQGCGNTDSGFVAGPQTEELERLAGGKGMAEIDMPVPIDPCRIHGTGYIVFRNISRITGYRLTVKGEDRGTVKPASELRVEVAAGQVEWMADPTNPKGATALTGSLKVDRCENYTVRIPFNEQTVPYEEAHN